MTALCLVNRSCILHAQGANPWRLFENLDVMQAAFLAHGVNPKNVHRNRMLQNRCDSPVEAVTRASSFCTLHTMRLSLRGRSRFLSRLSIRTCSTLPPAN